MIKIFLLFFCGTARNRTVYISVRHKACPALRRYDHERIKVHQLRFHLTDELCIKDRSLF